MGDDVVDDRGCGDRQLREFISFLHRINKEGLGGFWQSKEGGTSRWHGGGERG